MRERRRASGGLVDWAEIRRQVDDAGRKLAGDATRLPARVREILDERARLLARPTESPPDGDILDVVIFTLAGETYGIEARYVIEVFRLGALALLPGAEPPLFAVTAWRGELLTILDLRGALGLSPSALNDLNHAVVIGDERPAFGFLADGVTGMRSVRSADVHPIGERDAAARVYARGVTTDATLILEGVALLDLHQ